MKTSITAFLITLACGAMLHSTQSLAAAIYPSPVTKAETAIHHDFPRAQGTVWTKSGKELVASFTMGDSKVRAAYDQWGNLICTLINSPVSHLPFSIEAKLAKSYPGFTVYSMTEYISKNRHDYFMLLKNQSGNTINWMRVKSSTDGNSKIIRQLHQTIG